MTSGGRAWRARSPSSVTRRPVPAGKRSGDGEETSMHTEAGSAMTAANRRTAAAGGLYERLRRMIATDECVILDGAIGTELIKVQSHPPSNPVTRSMSGASRRCSTPRRRSRACIAATSTSAATWCAPTPGACRRRCATAAPSCRSPPSRCTGWTSPAEACGWLGMRRRTPAAPTRWPWPSASTATSTLRTGARRSACWRRAFEEEPPDLILLETLSLVRTSTYATVEALLGTGLPVWLSFRRCRHGVCGVYGEHWGGPEGDSFGRAARRFEEMGVGALALNCIPPDHVAGMLSWLRDFTDLPLGVYPNLGYLSEGGWRQQPGVAGNEYAELATSWRAEGAQIIGGCCGVRPEHLAAARAALTDTKPGHERPDASGEDSGAHQRAARARLDGRARSPHVPARGPRAGCRRRCVRPHAGELPDLEVPVPRGHRRTPALPGHRLRDGPADRRAGPQRRRSTCTPSTSTRPPSRTR